MFSTLRNPKITNLAINCLRNGDKVISAQPLIRLRPVFSFPSFRTTSEMGGVDKKLFTPGPLGCSSTVKQAMLRDLGSRDTEFIETVKTIRQKLLDIAGVSSEKYTTVPLQGSGTYSIEAVLQTTTPRNGGKVLILANGAYGQRMKRICDVVDIEYDLLFFNETDVVDVRHVEEHLKSSTGYTTVAIVHSETSSGIVNPVEHVGRVVEKHAPTASYFVDAMSSFGAIPLDVESSKVDFVVSSANKCLEGVPGFSYVIANKQKLRSCKGNCRSLSLDLVDQLEGFESGGQFRFTPPTHSMLAFKQALIEYEKEGGIDGRSARYKMNRSILRSGMQNLGFRELLDENHQGYIITSYHYPTDPKFDFNEFYGRLNDLGSNGPGQVIYPGKVTKTDCFRIGTIGQLFPTDLKHLVFCIERVCNEMGIEVPIK